MAYKYIPAQRDKTHYFESTAKRRGRLGGYVHGQALCGTGNPRQTTTQFKERVTCENCLQLIKGN